MPSAPAQLPDPRLLGVAPDDRPDRVAGHADLVRRQPVTCEHERQQVPGSDGPRLRLRVPRGRATTHIRSRGIGGTWPRRVAVATKKASGEVERHIEVSVAEDRGGRPRERLEKRRGRAAPLVQAVDLYPLGGRV